MNSTDSPGGKPYHMTMVMALAVFCSQVSHWGNIQETPYPTQETILLFGKSIIPFRKSTIINRCTVNYPTYAFKYAMLITTSANVDIL
jgi:hypothetical protein